MGQFDRILWVKELHSAPLCSLRLGGNPLCQSFKCWAQPLRVPCITCEANISSLEWGKSSVGGGIRLRENGLKQWVSTRVHVTPASSYKIFVGSTQAKEKNWESIVVL